MLRTAMAYKGREGAPRHVHSCTTENVNATCDSVPGAHPALLRAPALENQRTHLTCFRQTLDHDALA